MPDDRDVFAALTALVLERRASPEELERFRELLREHPEFIALYRRQVLMATLLPALSLWEKRENAGDQRSEVRGRRSETGDQRSAKHAWWKVAAAAAALFAGGVWWCKDARPPTSDFRSLTPDLRPPTSVASVRLVRQAGAEGLELPETLPGTLLLEAGTAWVRLASGVELALVGPLELEARDAMQVRLVSGRLLADVPPVASGFTVATPHLKMWDLGTVFGVSVSNGVSDVFVFKGEVQVNEASGEAVDLCRAGEGVRAAPGWRPYKVAADSFEARALLQRSEARGQRSEVRGQRSVAAMLEAAARIADLWGERHLPREAPPPPPPVPGLRGAAASPPPATAGRWSQVAGQKTKPITAPARQSAPGAKQEEAEMRGMTNTAAAVAAAAALGAAGAAYAVPEVTNVQMAQRENSRIVDVWYDLGGEAAIVTLGIETNGVPIPEEAVTRLSGDVSVVVQPGADRHIVWNAGADWPEHSVTNARARVTAWHTNAPPQYCVVDLAGGYATNVWPVYYYPSAEALPNGGVTNNLYKTVLLAMRRVDPTGGAGFMMGSPATESHRNGDREDWHRVVLTKGYYVGVYQVTQYQWQLAMGNMRSWPSRWNNNDYRPTRPVEQVSYFDIRENPSGNGSAISPNWPQSDAAGPESFMGRIRSKTGIAGFDLPTDAQWEYACRAGTEGALNDGTVNITNSASDARLDLLGRYERNGGRTYDGSAYADPPQGCTTANATAAVGSYAPNAWGLYDMHGNVWEWCLDWFDGVGHLGTDAVTDPVGAAAGSSRVLRGGSWNSPASDCRSAFRFRHDPSTRTYYVGFRLVRTLP